MTYDPNQATWEFLREENRLPTTDIVLPSEIKSGDSILGLGTILSFYTGDEFKTFVAILQWVQIPSWAESYPNYGIIAIYMHDDPAYQPGHWVLTTIQEVGRGINWTHKAI